MKNSTKKLIRESAKSEIINRFKNGVINHSDWNAHMMFGELPHEYAGMAYEEDNPGAFKRDWDNLSDEDKWDAEDARDQFIETCKKQIDEADESKLKEIAEKVCPTYVRDFLINEGVINHKPVL